jgi:hypothetical protein
MRQCEIVCCGGEAGIPQDGLELGRQRVVLGLIEDDFQRLALLMVALAHEDL